MNSSCAKSDFAQFFKNYGTDVKVRIANYYSQKGGLDLKLEIKGKLTDYVKMQPETN